MTRQIGCYRRRYSENAPFVRAIPLDVDAGLLPSYLSIGIGSIRQATGSDRPQLCLRKARSQHTAGAASPHDDIVVRFTGYPNAALRWRQAVDDIAEVAAHINVAI